MQADFVAVGFDLRAYPLARMHFANNNRPVQALAVSARENGSPFVWIGRGPALRSHCE